MQGKDHKKDKCQSYLITLYDILVGEVNELSRFAQENKNDLSVGYLLRINVVKVNKKL